MARDWLATQGSEEMLRAARNTLLGETWVESRDAPEWQRLAERREAFGTQNRQNFRPFAATAQLQPFWGSLRQNRRQACVIGQPFAFGPSSH
ncbi:terminase gpA endonuclease subunit [Octadecabacter antarcticus]|uniref:terminase gpA endonuclease subunit n=1 Tax=Octadecabacter antarcticus TaxID=1217908 RepID=UPI002FDDE5E8